VEQDSTQNVVRYKQKLAGETTHFSSGNDTVDSIDNYPKQD
jgi:hypothetical protein